ncbi:MAG: hypothetical protein GW854_08085 [Erythrobacter sp.]|nr:hypothetical protein [Erythrobacter sp.]
MSGIVFDRLAASLMARAERIARTRRRASRSAPRSAVRNADRWRSAPYLWPLFAN